MWALTFHIDFSHCIFSLTFQSVSRAGGPGPVVDAPGLVIGHIPGASLSSLLKAGLGAYSPGFCIVISQVRLRLRRSVCRCNVRPNINRPPSSSPPHLQPS